LIATKDDLENTRVRRRCQDAHCRLLTAACCPACGLPVRSTGETIDDPVGYEDHDSDAKPSVECLDHAFGLFDFGTTSGTSVRHVESIVLRRNHAIKNHAIKSCKTDSNYTRQVRVVVASFLLFLLVTIACVDPLYCSDGCDQGGMAATHSTQTGGDCPTCLSAVVARRDAPIVRTETVTQICHLSAPAPISLFRTDVDYPPRSAEVA